ncbi:hypothetical protein WN943_029472 [Citrus x changshan-huyou]
MAKDRKTGTNNSDWSFICSATEIKEAGIKFQKIEVIFATDADGYSGYPYL